MTPESLQLHLMWHAVRECLVSWFPESSLKGAHISEKSREKVLKAAEGLGYRVHFLARGLQTRQSNLVEWSHLYLIRHFTQNK